MIVVWVGPPRTIAATQQEVRSGDVVEVDGAAGASLIEQGHAEAAPTTKENK